MQHCLSNDVLNHYSLFQDLIIHHTACWTWTGFLVFNHKCHKDEPFRAALLSQGWNGCVNVHVEERERNLFLYNVWTMEQTSSINTSELITATRAWIVNRRGRHVVLSAGGTFHRRENQRGGTEEQALTEEKGKRRASHEERVLNGSWNMRERQDEKDHNWRNEGKRARERTRTPTENKLRGRKLIAMLARVGMKKGNSFSSVINVLEGIHGVLFIRA